MKRCETCGKAISAFDVYETNGKIQCKDCALKELYFNDEKDDNRETDDEIPKIGGLSKEKHVDITNGWASGMKILSIILLLVLFIASIVIAYFIGEESDSFILGFVCFIGFAISSFAIVGFSMSFLQLAQDVSYIKNSIERDNENRE